MSNRPVLSPRLALVDTGAYFALSDTKETRHPLARTVFERLTKERWRLYTTNFIIAETHALLLTRLGYQAALRFMERVDSSSIAIIRVTEDDERRAREIIRQYNDKKFSFTDATSFVVMARLGIPYAFTFDRNFTQYGLTVLTPDHFSQR